MSRTECPFLQEEYDHERKRIYKCGSIRPHSLVSKIYNDEERRERKKHQLWVPYEEAFSQYNSKEVSCNGGRWENCHLFQATVRPFLEKAGFKENGKCVYYISQSITLTFLKEKAIEVKCKLLDYSFFDPDKPLPCLTNCHDCRGLRSSWWVEPGPCKFQEVLSDTTVREEDGGWMKDVRYITFNCKAQGRKCTITEPYKCSRWKYECLDYNRARKKEIGFEGRYLPY